VTPGATTGTVDVGGARLWYEQSGEGPPVVLLHAGIADARMWDEQVGPFGVDHRVVRYDLRGFGRSDPPIAPFATVDDLCVLMDALDVERASLVGVSMGAGAAVDFTLEHPDRVDRLVPVAPGLRGFDWPEDPGNAAIETAMETAFESGDLDRLTDLTLDVWAPLGTAGPGGEGIRAMVRHNVVGDAAYDEFERRLDPPAMARLEEIRVPTLVMLGDRDVPAIETMGSAIAARVRGARKVVLSPADHLVPMRVPVEFNRTVLEFLAGRATA
jgi:3-oxoadipate enol-lactonase